MEIDEWTRENKRWPSKHAKLSPWERTLGERLLGFEMDKRDVNHTFNACEIALLVSWTECDEERQRVVQDCKAAGAANGHLGAAKGHLGAAGKQKQSAASLAKRVDACLLVWAQEHGRLPKRNHRTTQIEIQEDNMA